jgi:hypothetical protein
MTVNHYRLIVLAIVAVLVMAPTAYVALRELL